MLRCICCKDHVHIVLGADELTTRSPDQFGWPIFTQRDVLQTEIILLENQADNEEERRMFRDLFSKIYPRLKKQGRNQKGQFTGLYLPKDNMSGSVNYPHLIKEWRSFVKGEKGTCQYILEGVPIWNVLIWPLSSCSLISYITPPPKEHSYKGYEGTWEGIFQISEQIEVI